MLFLTNTQHTNTTIKLTSVGDGSGRVICGWMGVVWVWSTDATVSSGHGWLDVVVAWKADLNWKL